MISNTHNVATNAWRYRVSRPCTVCQKPKEQHWTNDHRYKAQAKPGNADLCGVLFYKGTPTTSVSGRWSYVPR